MKPNTVFPNLGVAACSRIINELKARFASAERSAPQGARQAVEITTPEGRINLICYNNGKLMIQSSPDNPVYASIVSSISESACLLPVEKPEPAPREAELIGEYHVGCDEAGAGESFGSMFLGCAVVPRQNLDAVRDAVRYKNIRQLDETEVSQTVDAVSGYFEGSVRIIPASDIDGGSKNTLLDRGYADLIDSAVQNRSSISIVIDDYGIRRELEKYLEKVVSGGSTVVVKHRADEQYTACKLASLIARKARMDEMGEINRTYGIIDDKTGEIIRPGSGNASNPMTERYLLEYKKRHPHAEFPPFVRKKWANVAKTDERCQPNVTRGIDSESRT